MAQKTLPKPLPALVCRAETPRKTVKTASGTILGVGYSLALPPCRKAPKTALRGVVFVQHSKKKLKKPLTYPPIVLYCKYGDEKKTKRPKPCDIQGDLYRHWRHLYRFDGCTRSSVSQVRKDSLAETCEPRKMRGQILEFLQCSPCAWRLWMALWGAWGCTRS